MIYRVMFEEFSVLREDNSIEQARAWAKKAFPKSNPTIQREAVTREFCNSCDCSPCVCRTEDRPRRKAIQ